MSAADPGATPAVPRGILTRLSLRARLLTIGVIGVAVALLLGGLALYAAVSTSLDRTVDAQLRAIVTQVVTLVDTNRLPDPIPQSGAQVVQVLDAQHRVLDGSATADRLTPLVSQDERAAIEAGQVLVVPANRAAQSGALRVAGAATGTGEHRVFVVAALPTAEMQQARDTLRALLLGSLPVFLLVMAAVAWRVVGAALRPVEDLRRGAERIGADPGAPERLPVPAADDEIAALATTLNSMLDRLASAQAKQRGFLADAAHELRSPLAAMRMQVDVADHLGETSGLPAELAPEIERLTTLVEDLLTLARAGDARPEAAEAVAVRPLLAELATRYAGARVPVLVRANAADAAGASDLGAGAGDGGEPTAYLSRADLVRALTNLVDNAVRHAATRVELALEAVESPPTAAATLVVAVTDDGHGIPAAERERVFERFARLDEGRARDEGGSGLGLPICRELLRRNGGDVHLEDAAPGVRAVVTLP